MYGTDVQSCFAKAHDAKGGLLSSMEPAMGIKKLHGLRRASA